VGAHTHPARRRPSVVDRFIRRPFYEGRQALRDIASSDAREARDLMTIARIDEIGETRFVVRAVIRVTALLEAFTALTTLGSVMSGRFSWHLFATERAWRSFVFIGMASVIVSTALATREIARLRREYGEPDEPRA
jgi:hypothetical protein